MESPNPDRHLKILERMLWDTVRGSAAKLGVPILSERPSDKKLVHSTAFHNTVAGEWLGNEKGHKYLCDFHEHIIGIVKAAKPAAALFVIVDHRQAPWISEETWPEGLTMQYDFY